MKKKYFFLFIIIAIIIIFFVKNNYKNFKFGNNDTNKSVNDVEKYILNLNSYTATLEVVVDSNKNSNKYILKQEYKNNGNEKQIVIKPENISGTEILYSNNNLEIKNSQLNLNKLYSNYPYLSENVLWLSSFINSYKSEETSKKTYEENDCIVMQINSDGYYNTKRLYLEKGTGTPKKMEIEDTNKKSKIYIVYTEICINK